MICSSWSEIDLLGAGKPIRYPLSLWVSLLPAQSAGCTALHILLCVSEESMREFLWPLYPSTTACRAIFFGAKNCRSKLGVRPSTFRSYVASDCMKAPWDLLYTSRSIFEAPHLLLSWAGWCYWSGHFQSGGNIGTEPSWAEMNSMEPFDQASSRSLPLEPAL